MVRLEITIYNNVHEIWVEIIETLEYLQWNLSEIEDLLGIHGRKVPMDEGAHTWSEISQENLESIDGTWNPSFGVFNGSWELRDLREIADFSVRMRMRGLWYRLGWIYIDIK